MPKRTDRAESSEEPEGAGKSSIFGSAKPVDTAKKEAEIELKLQVRRLIIFLVRADLFYIRMRIISIDHLIA